MADPPKPQQERTLVERLRRYGDLQDRAAGGDEGPVRTAEGDLAREAAAALAEAEARIEAAYLTLRTVAATTVELRQALASQTKLLREVAEDFEKRADEAEAMADRQDGPQGWPTAQANRQGAVAFREAASLLRSRLSTVEGAEKK